MSAKEIAQKYLADKKRKKTSRDKVRKYAPILLERQGNRCAYCGVDLSTTGYHIDHVIPLAHNGSDELSNLRAACPTCNVDKGAKLGY